MTREEAIKILKAIRVYECYPKSASEETKEAIDMAIEALSAEGTKKKAELKENGDWDCPDVYCDECDHHRSVSWCALAIPDHEKIDEEYKIRQEEFFKGLHAAEEHYKTIVEVLDEIDEKFVKGEYVEPIRCKDCRHHGMRDCPVWGDDTTEDYMWCYCGERRKP